MITRHTKLHSFASVGALSAVTLFLAGGCAVDASPEGDQAAQGSEAYTVIHGFTCDATAANELGTFTDSQYSQSWPVPAAFNLCGMSVLELDNPDEASGTIAVDVPEWNEGLGIGTTSFAVYGGTRTSATTYQWETVSAKHNVVVKGCTWPHPRICHIIGDNTAFVHAGYDKIRIATLSEWAPGGTMTPTLTNVSITPGGT